MKPQYYIVITSPAGCVYFLFRDAKRKQWRAHQAKHTPIASELGARRLISKWLHPMYHDWAKVRTIEFVEEDRQA